MGKVLGKTSAAEELEFDKPWRDMSWGGKKAIEQRLREFGMSEHGKLCVRIMMVGDVGAGKSSFINTVNNAFQGRITCEALVASGSSKSFTKKYTTHYIKGEDRKPLNFILNDVMGLECGNDEGVHKQDIITALQGFIKEGYNFNPTASVRPNDPSYRSNPTIEEQAFCLVNVVAADKVSIISDEVVEKLSYIRQEASTLGIPQVIVMTRVDLACPLVQKDLTKLYKSKKIKQKIAECSNRLTIPEYHIFPVKNYHNEIDPNDNIDLLALKALDHIAHIAADAMEKKSRVERKTGVKPYCRPQKLSQ